jgi:hypothetical protein
MKKTDVFPVLPGVSLAELKTIIEQTEALEGPLLAVSPYEHSATWLTFVRDASPAGEIAVELVSAGQSVPTKDGFSLVCIGDCFIEGVARGVAVYRKTS